MRADANVSVAPPRDAALAMERSFVVSPRGLALAARDVSYALIAFIALVWVFFSFKWGVTNDVIGFDFKGTLWDAAVAIREGRSPYPAPVLEEVEVGNPALYPPLLMLVVAPLTVLPWAVGLAIWSFVLGAAIMGGLYILGVRDLRCYGLALIGQFTVVGLIFGNATLLLVPLVALAWHWRDRWPRVGVVLGLAIASKLFLWPLLLWLLGTRRYKAFAAALGATLVAVLVPWALIGFDGLRDYPDLLRTAEEAYATHGYSIVAVLNGLGVELDLAAKITLAIGVALAAVGFAVGRRGADAAAVSLAIVAAVAGSPIVWPYYYALLLVPVAIARPRFSGLWIALTVFYASNWLTRDLLTEEELAISACCRPDDIPFAVWSVNHSPPALWHALAYVVIGSVLVAAVISKTRRAPSRA